MCNKFCTNWLRSMGGPRSMGGGGLIVPLQQAKWAPTMHPQCTHRLSKEWRRSHNHDKVELNIQLVSHFGCTKCVQSYVETISNSTCHIHIEDQWCEESFSDTLLTTNVLYSRLASIFACWSGHVGWKCYIGCAVQGERTVCIQQYKEFRA